MAHPEEVLTIFCELEQLQRTRDVDAKRLVQGVPEFRGPRTVYDDVELSVEEITVLVGEAQVVFGLRK